MILRKKHIQQMGTAWMPFADAASEGLPLAQLLRKRIDFERLPELLRSGALKALAITASSYGNGEHVTFFDSAQAIEPWTRNQRVAHASRLTHEHLLASSAIFTNHCSDREGSTIVSQR